MTIEGGDDLVEQGSAVRHRLGPWHDLRYGDLMSGAAFALVLDMLVEPADRQLEIIRRFSARQVVIERAELGQFRDLGFRFLLALLLRRLRHRDAREILSNGCADRLDFLGGSSCPGWPSLRLGLAWPRHAGLPCTGPWRQPRRRC